MANGVEVGVGYLSLTVEAQGIEEELKRKVRPAAENEGDAAGKESGKKFGESFGSGAKLAVGAAGIGIGAALGKGMLDAMSNEVGTDKLAAQLGINNPEFAASLGKTAGRVYAGGFGESMPQVNEALRGVLANGLLPEDAADADIERITGKVLNLASVFGLDLAESTRTVSRMIENGLAPNADAALDILTRGFQQGNDQAGDLLSTFSEYSVQFDKLGLDGTESMGLISQGLKAGARDADTVADALKEFSIRAIDGSNATGTAYEALGLDAQAMQAKIAAGGEGAQQGLTEVLAALNAMEDPSAKAAAAVGLFGTKAEDMGESLFALDPTRAVAFMGTVEGAADQMGNTLADNTASKFETFRRKIEVGLSGIAAGVGPVLSVAPALGGLAAVASTLGGPLGAAAGAMGRLGLSVLTTTGHLVASTAAWVASSAAKAAAAAVSGVMTAAQWALNVALSANPIGLIIIAIVALVAAIILAYQNSETFRNIIQSIGAFLADTLWPILKRVAEFIGDVFVAYIKLITLQILLWWEALQILARVAQDVAGGVVDAFGAVVGFLTGLPGRVAGALSVVFNPLRD